MKKMLKHILISLVMVTILSACASTPPYDRGVFNPNNAPEDTFCTLLIHSFIELNAIDGKYVAFSNTDRAAGIMQEKQTVTLPAGYHIFRARFNTVNAWSGDILVAGELEAGKHYFLDYHMHALTSKVDLVIEDKERGKEIQLSKKELKKRIENAQKESETQDFTDD